jgi:hypothetical protein
LAATNGDVGVVATAPVAHAAPASPSTLRPAPLRRAANVAPRRRFSDSIADYAYVAGDLRRIGMFAGGLVVLLVALSFIIR